MSITYNLLGTCVKNLSKKRIGIELVVWLGLGILTLFITPVISKAAECKAIYTNNQGNTYLECSDGWCGFDNKGWGGGQHQTICYNGIYSQSSAPKSKPLDKNAQCSSKYFGTIFREIDNMCICPNDGKGKSTWDPNTKACPIIILQTPQITRKVPQITRRSSSTTSVSKNTSVKKVNNYIVKDTNCKNYLSLMSCLVDNTTLPIVKKNTIKDFNNVIDTRNTLSPLLISSTCEQTMEILQENKELFSNAGCLLQPVFGVNKTLTKTINPPTYSLVDMSCINYINLMSCLIEKTPPSQKFTVQNDFNNIMKLRDSLSPADLKTTCKETMNQLYTQSNIFTQAGCALN